MEVKAGRRDIYTWDPEICWFNLFSWPRNTEWPSLHLAQPPGASWMWSLKARSGTRGEESLRLRVWFLHQTPRLPLRPCASQSKLSSSRVVPTVQLANTAINTPSGGKSTRNWCHRIENTSLFALRCFQLCQRWISTCNLRIYTIDASKYSAKNKCNTMITPPRRHKHPSSSANTSSDIAVTVNINAEFNLMAVNPTIECISMNLTLKYCHGSESCAVRWAIHLCLTPPWSLI